MFILDTRLAADTLKIGEFRLSDALLMNNSNLPWVILVPRRAGIREVYELSDKDQKSLFKESIIISQALMSEYRGDKLNTGAIGNLVPQLHLHHVIRYDYDAAWPQPVWGNLPSKPYTKITAKQTLKKLRILFSDHSEDFKASSS